ncbi:MAG: hypothetical protein HYX57_09675 [Chloroflexi bacterium]|nr:hypothetical protein [Chloroflexota bacterium]
MPAVDPAGDIEGSIVIIEPEAVGLTLDGPVEAPLEQAPANTTAAAESVIVLRITSLTPLR